MKEDKTQRGISTGRFSAKQKTARVDAKNTQEAREVNKLKTAHSFTCPIYQSTLFIFISFKMNTVIDIVGTDIIQYADNTSATVVIRDRSVSNERFGYTVLCCYAFWLY